MLMPKRVKYRRVHRGRLKGRALRGNKITNGNYGLVAQEPAWITSNQIEAARIAMTRYIRRGGQVWIKIFPDKPITVIHLLSLPGAVRATGGTLSGAGINYCLPTVTTEAFPPHFFVAAGGNVHGLQVSIQIGMPLLGNVGVFGGQIVETGEHFASRAVRATGTHSGSVCHGALKFVTQITHPPHLTVGVR